MSERCGEPGSERVKRSGNRRAALAVDLRGPDAPVGHDIEPCDVLDMLDAFAGELLDQFGGGPIRADDQALDREPR